MTLPWTTDKHAQMTTENSKGMNDASASNVGYISRKPLQYIHITTPCAGHIVEVTFQNDCNAYDLFSNTTQLFSSPFNSRKIMLYSSSNYTVVIQFAPFFIYCITYVLALWQIVFVRTVTYYVIFTFHQD